MTKNIRVFISAGATSDLPIVRRVLTDLDGMPLWRSDLTALERLPNVAGRPAWREIGRGGAQVVELTLADPPRRLVIQQAAGGRSVLPIRTFDLDSAATGTRRDLDHRLSAGRRQVAAEGAH